MESSTAGRVKRGTSFNYDYRIVREKAAVILSLGETVFKCGFSQEHAPRHVSDAATQSYTQELSARRNPRQWDEFAAKILKWVFFVALQTKPAERPVVIVESFLMNSEFRRALVRTLFKVFEVPLVLLLPYDVCALTLTGASSGIVVDLGETEMRVMPVFEHYLISSANGVYTLGLRNVTESLAEAMVTSRRAMVESLDPGFGDKAQLLADTESVEAEHLDQAWLKDMIFRLGAVRSKNEAEAAERKSDEGTSVPPSEGSEGVEGGAAEGEAAASGSTISVDTSKQPANETTSPAALLLQSVFECSPLRNDIVRQATETYFKGNSEGHSVVSAVLDCLCQCPIDLRTKLAQNVIVVGGGAGIANLTFRLQQELDAVIVQLYEASEPKSDSADDEETKIAASADKLLQRFTQISRLSKFYGVQVRPLTPFSATIAAWTGASVFASSTAFNRTVSSDNEVGGGSSNAANRTNPAGQSQFRFAPISLADYQADEEGKLLADRYSIYGLSPVVDTAPAQKDTLATAVMAKHFIKNLMTARNRSKLGRDAGEAEAGSAASAGEASP